MVSLGTQMDFGGNSLKLFRIISAMIIQTKCKWNNAEFNIPQTTFRAKELETNSTTRKQENLKNDHGIVQFRLNIDLERRRETDSWLNAITTIIIWLCLTRTGNYQIHEFDWLKWILTAV